MKVLLVEKTIYCGPDCRPEYGPVAIMSGEELEKAKEVAGSGGMITEMDLGRVYEKGIGACRHIHVLLDMS